MIQTDISNKVNKNLIINQEYKQFKTPKRKKESKVAGVNSGLYNCLDGLLTDFQNHSNDIGNKNFQQLSQDHPDMVDSIGKLYCDLNKLKKTRTIDNRNLVETCTTSGMKTP